MTQNMTLLTAETRRHSCVHYFASTLRLHSARSMVLSILPVPSIKIFTSLFSIYGGFRSIRSCCGTKINCVSSCSNLWPHNHKPKFICCSLSIIQCTSKVLVWILQSNPIQVASPETDYATNRLLEIQGYRSYQS